MMDAKQIFQQILNKNKVLNFENISTSIKNIIAPEKIKIEDYAFLAKYVEKVGILLNEKLDSTEKTVLLVHEYHHFLANQSAGYLSESKEEIDADVRDAIQFLVKNNNNEEFQEEVKDLAETPFYRKLFKSV